MVDRRLQRSGLRLLRGDSLARCCCATSSECPRRRGPSASIFQIAALVGALGVPVLLRALPDRAVVLIIGGRTLPVGLLVVPSWWLCGARSAAAQGGGLVVVRARRAHRARPHRELARVRAGPGRRVRRGRDRPNGDGSRARGNGRMDRPCWSCSERSPCSRSRARRRPAGLDPDTPRAGYTPAYGGVRGRTGLIAGDVRWTSGSSG